MDTLWGIRPGAEVLRQGERIGLLAGAGLTSWGCLGL
ncbi:hypothetical protein ACVWVQ_002458 [Thermostichus sp. MS-CIW-36]